MESGRVRGDVPGGPSRVLPQSKSHQLRQHADDRFKRGGDDLLAARYLELALRGSSLARLPHAGAHLVRLVQRPWHSQQGPRC